jgi:hypothetical protein
MEVPMLIVAYDHYTRRKKKDELKGEEEDE